MYKVLFLILLFLVILYIYSFVKIKKNKRMREQEPSFVEQYHKKYAERKMKEPPSKSNRYAGSASEIRNYVTKYNSPVDYIEKDSYYSK